ncbi:hypothetical protein [Streptomyces spectabilis]|uniref:Uncharacterized protein n=1 Tax=Streptomyces spectabilis TaxID=68270 RepID=A0A7W8B3P7_STRST|nr:hypothetical protein [Streptomyces spectabilis]MBB5108307.1 hypothetical protein [Streptomyces spectabilis]MCI3901066.1 hypothetical protein [Streptomyces spectabilis]
MDLAALSTEYVKITVVAKAGGASLNLGAPPEFAFLADGTTPDTGDWHTGEWLAPHARILIGPEGGETTLTEGDYRVWIKFAGGTETPIHRTGTLTIY